MYLLCILFTLLGIIYIFRCFKGRGRGKKRGKKEEYWHLVGLNCINITKIILLLFLWINSKNWQCQDCIQSLEKKKIKLFFLWGPEAGFFLLLSTCLYCSLVCIALISLLVVHPNTHMRPTHRHTHTQGEVTQHNKEDTVCQYDKCTN